MMDRRRVSFLAAGLMILAPAFTGILVSAAMLATSVYARLKERTARTKRMARDPHGAAASPASRVGAIQFGMGVRMIALGSLVFSIPTAIAHGSVDALALGIQLGWLLLLVVMLRTWWRRGWVDRRAVADGFAAGMAVLVAASLWDASGWLPTTMVEALGWTSFAGRASLWHPHPNILATIAVLPTLAVMAWGRRAAQFAAAAAALALVTATGSRAAFAVLLLVGPYLASRRTETTAARQGSSLRWAALISLAGIVTLLLVTFTTVFDRFDPRLAFAPGAAHANLLYASEDLHAGSWSRLGVRVQRVAPAAMLRGDREWVVEKTDDVWWARVQQGVTIPPQATVTLQIDLRQPDPAARPGLHARVEGPDGPMEVTVRRSAGVWTVVSVRGLELREWTTFDTGHWTSLTLTIANPSKVSIPLALGLTPDQRSSTTGSRMWVRRPQAVMGAPAEYEPTRPSGADSRSSLGTWSDRMRWARIGWHGFLERPWFGHGTGTFPEYVVAQSAALGEVSPEAIRPVAHAHQLFSQTAFERGGVGLAGLALLTAGFVVAAHRGRPSGWWTMGLVMLLNVIDYSFWTTPVSYLLGAITGLAGNGARVASVRRTPRA